MKYGHINWLISIDNENASLLNEVLSVWYDLKITTAIFLWMLAKNNSISTCTLFHVFSAEVVNYYKNEDIRIMFERVRVGKKMW